MRLFLNVFAVGTLIMAGTAHAAEVERFSLVREGRNVGDMTAETDQGATIVDLRVNDNGRGAKLRETIALGAGGIPRNWQITGTSELGSAVDERFAWQRGKAVWQSQADKGTLTRREPGLYLVNDDTPWSQYVYARAALAAPGATLAMVPGGQLSVVKVADFTVGSGAAAVPVAAYRLDGVQIEPSYVLLDKDQRLFAAFGRYLAVRQGYEAEEAALRAFGDRLERERITAISAKVTKRFDVPVRLRNVHVVDVRTGTRGPLSTVVFHQGRFTLVQPGDTPQPRGAEVVIDGEGGTIYPGLHDMHIHTSLRSGLFDLAAGVTGTRDMGNLNAFIADILPRLKSGEIAGPHMVPNGFVEGRSPFSANNGIIVGTLAEGLDAVRWYAERGYHEIKFYNSMDPALIKPLAAEAHRLGMGVTGHVPAFTTPDQVIADGFDGIAHINQLMLSWMLRPGEDSRTPLRITAMDRAAALDLDDPKVQRTIALMKQHKVAIDPTIVTFEQFMLSRAGAGFPAQRDYMAHMPFGYQRFLKRNFVPINNGADDARYKQAFDKVLKLVGLLHREGIQLLPGTDDTNGFFAQREVELFTLAGLTPAEALRAASLGSAEYLGRGAETGSIERGKLADFVLVPGNPLADIAAIKRPRMVVRAGDIFLPSEIYQSFGIKPFVAPVQIGAPVNRP